jgi:hypothetical protein
VKSHAFVFNIASLTRDFSLEVFFMNQFAEVPGVSHWGHLIFLRKTFAEIFATLCSSPVAMTPAKIFAGYRYFRTIEVFRGQPSVFYRILLSPSSTTEAGTGSTLGRGCVELGQGYWTMGSGGGGAFTKLCIFSTILFTTSPTSADVR